MFKLIACTILLGMAVTQIMGCQSTGIDRDTVSRGLAGGAGSNLDRDKIHAAGEEAIPLVLDELRAHPDEGRLSIAVGMVSGMADNGVVDPKAPALLAALEDTKENEAVRCAVATMLGWYWQSPAVEMTLVKRVKMDKSIAVRADCLAAVSTWIGRRGGRTGIWKVDTAVRQLFADALADKSTRIREEASVSIGCIAIGAARHGVDVTWCRPLLLEAKRDREKSVHRAAIDMLLSVDQETAKIRRSGRQMTRQT